MNTRRSFLGKFVAGVMALFLPVPKEEAMPLRPIKVKNMLPPDLQALGDSESDVAAVHRGMVEYLHRTLPHCKVREPVVYKKVSTPLNT